MSNELTNRIAAELATVSPTASWETKAGKARVAYTATGADMAPVAQRRNAADTATLRALVNGGYTAFYRDAVGALTIGHRKVLASELNKHFAAAKIVNPVLGTVVQLDHGQLDGLRPNKDMMLTVARFLAHPQRIVKKVVEDAELKGQKARYSDIAYSWLEHVSKDTTAIAE